MNDRQALHELIGLVKGILWITECRCDEDYTKRHMHAPNTLCGELDELADWVKNFESGYPPE